MKRLSQNGITEAIITPWSLQHKTKLTIILVCGQASWGFHHPAREETLLPSRLYRWKVLRPRGKKKLLKNQALGSRAHLSYGDQGPLSKDGCPCQPLLLALFYHLSCLNFFMALSQSCHLFWLSGKPPKLSPEPACAPHSLDTRYSCVLKSWTFSDVQPPSQGLGPVCPTPAPSALHPQGAQLASGSVCWVAPSPRGMPLAVCSPQSSKATWTPEACWPFGDSGMAVCLLEDGSCSNNRCLHPSGVLHAITRHTFPTRYYPSLPSTLPFIGNCVV